MDPIVHINRYIQYSNSQYLGVNGINGILSNTTPTTFWFTAYVGSSLNSMPSYILTNCNVTNNLYVYWNYQFCGNVGNSQGGITYNHYGVSFPDAPVVVNENVNLPINPNFGQPPTNSIVCAYISYSSGNPTCPTQVSQLQTYCLSINPTNGVPSCCNIINDGVDKGKMFNGCKYMWFWYRELSICIHHQ